MNGDEYDKHEEEEPRKRTAWEVMQEDLLEPIAVELRPSVAGMQNADDGDIIELSFQDLQQRTICESFPGGLDFSSDPGSHRRFFYEKRVEIADEFILYFASVYGYGLKFTANPLLGLRWKEEIELERSHSMANTSEAMWAIAKGQVPQNLRASCDYFLHRTAERRALIAKIQRENEARYLQLARGENEDQDGD